MWITGLILIYFMWIMTTLPLDFGLWGRKKLVMVSLPESCGKLSSSPTLQDLSMSDKVVTEVPISKKENWKLGSATIGERSRLVKEMALPTERPKLICQEPHFTYSDIGTTAAGVTFVDSTGASVATVGSVHANFDGLSRNDRLRYDSPKLGPVILSASATNGDAWELAARVTTELENIGKIAAAIGYVDSQDRSTPEFDQIGASISWLHDTGVNLTLVYGVRDPDGGIEAENYYAKLGYKRGKHAVSVEWGQTDDLAAAGDEANSYGAGYVFNVYKGIELYAGYRLYELDRSSGLSIEDINILMAGTRVKFW